MPMQFALKISLAISIVLAVASVLLLPGGIHETAKDIANTFLIVSMLALPGLFIKSRIMKFAAATNLIVALVIIAWSYAFHPYVR
jgi:uncharacterized membrane protein YadS